MREIERKRERVGEGERERRSHRGRERAVIERDRERERELYGEKETRDSSPRTVCMRCLQQGELRALVYIHILLKYR